MRLFLVELANAIKHVLAPRQDKAVRHFINTERARCLFIVKNSLIHQARLEPWAFQHANS